MYERFSRPALQVLEAAEREARSASPRTAGTDNLLFALAETGTGTARRVLIPLGFEAGAARKLSAAVSDPADTETRTFNPDARRALEFAIRESARRAHEYIGTAHILLGVISSTQAAGTRIIIASGVDIELLKAHLEQALSDDAEARDLGPNKKSKVAHRLSTKDEQVAMHAPDEVYALKQEIDRLRGLLRKNGIDPSSADLEN